MGKTIKVASTRVHEYINTAFSNGRGMKMKTASVYFTRTRDDDYTFQCQVFFRVADVGNDDEGLGYLSRTLHALFPLATKIHVRNPRVWNSELNMTGWDRVCLVEIQHASREELMRLVRIGEL